MAITTTNENRTTVRGLGEIALRVNNLDAMQKFYEEVTAWQYLAKAFVSTYYCASAILRKEWQCNFKTKDALRRAQHSSFHG